MNITSKGSFKMRVSKKTKCSEIVLRQKFYTAKFHTAKIPEASFPAAIMFTTNVPDTVKITDNVIVLFSSKILFDLCR